MFRYRLYTEDKKEQWIVSLFHEFAGLTIYHPVGEWKGKSEYALVIELISDSASTLSVLKGIAEVIKQENKQGCVLVTREPVEAFTF